MATWTGYMTNATSDPDWNFTGAGTALAALQTADGTKYMWTYNYASGAGAKLLATFAGSNPGTGTITAINLTIRWSRNAAGAGHVDFMSMIGASKTYSDTYILFPAVGWKTRTTTLSFPRPGGGSWTWADLATAWFGIEQKGDGNYSSRGLVDYMELVVTYTGTLPTADFTYSTTTGSAPLTVNFTDSASQTPSEWGWAFGDGGTAVAQNPSHIYTSPGTYTVTETATNTYGSDSEVKASLIHVQTAAATVACTFTGDPLSGVFPVLVNFFDGATGNPAPVSWAWDFGDSGTSTEQNPSHAYQVAGTYSVIHTASNTATSGSVSTATRTDYISVLDGRPQPTITADTTSGVRALAVQFTGSANNPATAWTWDFGDGGSSFEQSPAYTYQDAGTYSVALSAANANGLLSTTATDFINVGFIPPAADFTLDLAEGPEPLLVQFTNLSTGDITAYTWSFGDGQTSSLSSPSHLYTSAGTYAAVLTVAGTAGTSATTATGITVVHVIEGGDSYDFASELQEQLMDNVGIVSPCDAFEEFGGAANVYRIIHDRVVRFVMETGILQKEATLGAAISTGMYDLPSDLIELRRVEVDGTPIRRVDQKMMDYANQTWEASTDDFMGYIFEPSVTPLTLTLVPLKSASTAVKVMYVYAPPNPDLPQTCTDPWPVFPLPGVFWWIIKYGVLADLLSNEGDLYDVERARICDKLYDEGVQLTKMMLDKERV